MINATERTNTTDTPLRQPKLFSTIFECYRKNFVVFWGIMVPLIIFSLLFKVPNILAAGLPTSEALWHFDTSRGISVNSNPDRVGIGWGTYFIYAAIMVKYKTKFTFQ